MAICSQINLSIALKLFLDLQIYRVGELVSLCQARRVPITSYNRLHCLQPLAVTRRLSTCGLSDDHREMLEKSKTFQRTMVSVSNEVLAKFIIDRVIIERPEDICHEVTAQIIIIKSMLIPCQ